MKPGLSLRVSQHLALTPQLQQSIRLLQLSTLELQSEVAQMLLDNPLLEQDDEHEDGGAPEPAAASREDAAHDGSPAAEGDAPDGGTPDSSSLELPADWEGETPRDDGDSEGGTELPARGQTSTAGGGDDEDALLQVGAHESLAEHLQQQALSLHLEPATRAALEFLIGSLNDDGYLDDDPQALAAALAGDDAAVDHEALEHCFTVALRLLQAMEPAGVGARDLAECLQLQLQALLAGAQDDEEARPLMLAQAICRQPLDWLARRDLRRLGQACEADEGALREAMALIARLEPRPGRRFADVSRHAITPDVIVRRRGSGFAAQLNAAVMPRLHVHEAYAQALRSHRGSEGLQALQSRLQEARWFIKNIQQRFDTILRVSQAIVQRQQNFFEHGELAMRPLVLREIADELGLHESTISRVTGGKYMATPQGTYELKYFFGSGLGTDSGGSASSTAVRALIRQLIAEEDPAKPLSDAKIADLLKEQGIECARRTVAKYREALKIAPTQLRRQL